MEQQIRFCTTSDGVRIAYAIYGEGPPFVWVPGWVSHQELMWEDPTRRASIEAFAGDFQVILYDKRGTGLSDRGVKDYSTEARLRDLDAVVDSLELGRFTLFGISEGGPVAIAYAAAHPERVSRLVLYGTFARGPRLSANDEGRKTIDALIALVRAEWGLGSRTLTNLFVPDGSREDVAAFVKLQQVGASSEDAAVMLEANVDADVSDLLPKIKAPTLVIHVRGDLAVPFELGRELAGGITGARLVPIEGDSHVPTGEAAAQMRRAILDFAREDRESDHALSAPGGKESGAVTVLFTDIEDSTELTQRLGDAKARDVLRAHEHLVREALTSHAGSEVKTMGDGFMASFASATRALECAVALQRRIAEQNESADEPLRVRIGLNAGEPIEEEDDLFGTAVIVAARITAKANGGEILASDVVRQLVAGKGFLFADRGEVVPKGFEEPVRLYEVRWQE